MANDLYTGCQPVFVPTNSVVMGLRGIIMLLSTSGLMLLGRRCSKIKTHSCSGDGEEDALGLLTHSCL
jgi:hypothetical protein